MISYIVTYRQSTNQRYRNLLLTLAWLECIRTRDLEVVIVEQDSTPKLALDKQYTFLLRVVFARNPYLFNRAWGFNVGSNAASHNVLFFGDADLIVSPVAIERSNQLIYRQEYDVVSPFSQCCDLDARSSKSIDLRSFDYNKQGKVRSGICFCGGIVAFSRIALNKIRGWDERFEGWGGEDDVQSMKVLAHLRYTSLQGQSFHFFHKRSKNDGSRRHDNYKSNFNLFKRYKKNPALLEEDVKGISDLGNVNKYAAY